MPAHARGVASARRLGAKSIADFRAMSANQVNAAAPWNFTMIPMLTAFSPNIDHFVVPDVPAARFDRGQQLRIQLLAGWNAAEYYPFLQWNCGIVRRSSFVALRNTCSALRVWRDS